MNKAELSQDQIESDRQRKAFGTILQHGEIAIYGASQPASGIAQQFWKSTRVRRL